MSVAEIVIFGALIFGMSFLLARFGIEWTEKRFMHRRAVQSSEASVKLTVVPRLESTLRLTEKWPPPDWEDLLDKFVQYPEPDSKNEPGHILADWNRIERLRSPVEPSKGALVPEHRHADGCRCDTCRRRDVNAQACECFDFTPILETITTWNGDVIDISTFGGPNCECGHGRHEHDESSCVKVRRGPDRAYIKRRAQELGVSLPLGPQGPDGPQAPIGPRGPTYETSMAYHEHHAEPRRWIASQTINGETTDYYEGDQNW